jgi:hypothetical protein
MVSGCRVCGRSQYMTAIITKQHPYVVLSSEANYLGEVIKRCTFRGIMVMVGPTLSSQFSTLCAIKCWVLSLPRSSAPGSLSAWRIAGSWYMTAPAAAHSVMGLQCAGDLGPRRPELWTSLILPAFWSVFLIFSGLEVWRQLGFVVHAGLHKCPWFCDSLFKAINLVKLHWSWNHHTGLLRLFRGVYYPLP